MKRILLTLVASPALMIGGFEVGCYVKTILVSKTIPSCELLLRLIAG